MHLLGALDQPTTGVLRVGGRDIAGMSGDELATDAVDRAVMATRDGVFPHLGLDRLGVSG